MFTASTLRMMLAVCCLTAGAAASSAIAQTSKTPAPGDPPPASLPPETAAPSAPAPPAASSLPDAPASAPSASGQSAQFPDAPGATVAHANIEPTGPLAVFDTSMGRLTCRLFEKESPLAVANFIGLATGTRDWTDPETMKKVHGKPYYDGTTFHRVIPNFMIQGGDRKGDGTGDAGYYFADEVTPGLNFDVPGRLAMANSGPNTNGSQFFITEVPYPDLDGKYSIFGQCDSHTVLMVATIARVDRNSNDKPLSPVTLNKVTIVRNGEPMPPLPTGTGTAGAPSSNSNPPPRTVVPMGSPQ